MFIPTYQSLRSLYLSKGYKFYEEGQYNVNLFGIRNKDHTVVDQFNDLLGVAYKDEFGVEQCLAFQGTTKPGLTYLNKLGNPNGTAIVCPGQYPGVWMIGFHHRGESNQYPAYEQKGVFKCYRDNILNGKFDMTGPIYTDGAGINGHRGPEGGEIVAVGPWSSACQVCSSGREHSIWLNVGWRCSELYGNSFTYTLFDEP